MIARLVMVDALASWRRWTASFVVMTCAAVIALVCAGDFSTAAVLADPVDAAGLRNHAMIFGVMNSVVVVGALAVLVQFSIRSRRRDFALWQFAGIGPRLIRRVVLLQVVTVALLALAIAFVAIMPTLSGLMTILSAPLRDVGAPPLRARLGIQEAAIAVGVFLLVVVLSAYGAARAAERTPALLAIRDPEAEEARPGLGRRITGILLGVIAVAMYLLVLVGDRGVSSGFLVPAAGAVLCSAPWISAHLLPMWSGIVPERASAVWYVARRCATYGATRSNAAVALLSVTLVLASLMGLMGLLDDPTTMLAGAAIFGAPVFVIVFTGAATVVMTTAERSRDSALLVVAGGTFRTAIAVAVCEACILVGTAVLVALPIGLLAMPATASARGLDTVLLIPVFAALGLVVMVIATVGPVLRTRRRPLGPQLAQVAG